MAMLRVLLCRTGRHAWVRTRNPDVGGRAAEGEVCRHCGKDRSAYGKPVPTTGW